VGFTQGFHSFASYRIKQKSKVLIFNVIFAIAFTSPTSQYED